MIKTMVTPDDTTSRKRMREEKKSMQSYIALTTPRLQSAAMQFSSKARTVNQHLVELLMNCSFWLELFCGTSLLLAEPFGNPDLLFFL